MLGRHWSRPVAPQDPDDDRKMALWKVYMTEQDKFRGEAAKDFAHCRRDAWASRSWDCLWNTAWFGPHGFMTGNNLEEDDKTAKKLASCHCYFKWFFEKPAHVETPKEKRFREDRDKQKYRKDLKPGLHDVIPGKNIFVHLFFGIMFGWLLALLNTFFTGGTAPWATWNR